MDGYDIDDIDELNNIDYAFNNSQSESEGENANHRIPDSIRILTALQDYEISRKKYLGKKRKKQVSRSERERELELRVLRPNSIRRDILERTLREGNNKILSSKDSDINEEIYSRSKRRKRHRKDSEEEVSKDSKLAKLDLIDDQPNSIDAHDNDELIRSNFSDSVQPQDGSDEENFECPYCFNLFSNFNRLEDHVKDCKMKTPIDIHSSLVRKKLVSNSDTKLYETQPFHSSPKIKSVVKGKRKNTPKPTLTKKNIESPSDILTQLRSNVSKLASPPSTPQANISQKTSFYDKFIQCNSQTFSKSPKVDPFQCPYCFHGFLEFGSLQNHVQFCSKKPE